MSIQGILIIILFGLLLTVLIIHRIRLRKGRELLPDEEEEVLQEGMVKIAINRYEIWLRNAEVENFNSLPRKTRMQLAKVFDKRVKKGQLVPIIEKGVTLGFVTPQERERHAG